jgi:hypothetical protein
MPIIVALFVTASLIGNAGRLVTNPEDSYYAVDAGKSGGEIVADSCSERGHVVKVSPASKLYGELVLEGLGGIFYEGAYLITFYVRVEGGLGSDRAIAELEVARRGIGSNEDFVVTDMRRVTGGVFSTEEAYAPVLLYVSLGEPEEIDFRVRYIGNAVLYIDRVTAKKTS